MWSPTARALHSRTVLRYGSDLADAEWAMIALLLPKPCDRGRHRRWQIDSVLADANRRLAERDRRIDMLMKRVEDLESKQKSK